MKVIISEMKEENNAVYERIDNIINQPIRRLAATLNQCVNWRQN